MNPFLSLADRAYRFFHMLTVEWIQGADPWGTCPHFVDRVWNRYVYPVVFRMEDPLSRRA